LVLGIFPINPPGTLVLTSNRLRWQPNSLTGSRSFDISRNDITHSRIERWPSRLLLWLTLNVFYLLPAVRRSFDAKLAIRTSEHFYHFQVDEPDDWVGLFAGR